MFLSSDTYNLIFLCWPIHASKKTSNMWSNFAINWHRGENLLFISLILYCCWTSVMRANSFLKQIILVWWSVSLNHYLIVQFTIFLSSSWNIYLLSLPVNWRFQLQLLIFHTGWIISLMVHLIEIVFRIVKVLGSLIENSNLISIIHCYFLMKFIVKFKFFVKAATSWASSWISCSLSLPLDAFNDFPSFWINLCERINRTIFLMRM